MFFRPFTQRDTANPGRGIPATAAAAKAPPLHSEKISRFAVYCYICGRIFISDTMTQHISYPTVGTCSRQIDIELEEGVIRSVTFTGGCSGNTQGRRRARTRHEGRRCRRAARRHRLPRQGHVVPRPVGKSAETGALAPRCNIGNEFCTRQVHKIKTGNLCILSGTSC